MLNPMIKRVRKNGTARKAMCVDSGNMCFGRAVYEDMQSGDLGVIVNLTTGEVLVDLDTFLNARCFFENAEKRLEVGMTKKMCLYGTDDLVIARRIDVVAYGRGVWESADGVLYVVVMSVGGQFFMPLANFAANLKRIEREEGKRFE